MKHLLPLQNQVSLKLYAEWGEGDPAPGSTPVEAGWLGTSGGIVVSSARRCFNE